MESIRIECYAGSRAEEQPLRFYIGERKIEVISIEKRWLTPEQRYFAVTGDDGYCYELQYDLAQDTWKILKVK